MRAGCIALVGLVSLGCVPSFDDRPWLVEETRVLALATSPAEARPGEPVTMSVLLASPEGPDDVAVTWAFCTQPRSAAERGGVSEACATGRNLQPVSNPAAILPDACARFGPNPPPSEGDAPAQRPADPDPSGGYFLPYRAELSGLGGTAFGFARVRCDLPGVTRAIFEAFENDYRANENPRLTGFGVSGQLEVGATRPRVTQVESERSVALRVAVADESVEDYVVYDPERGTLRDRSELLIARWYVTGGELTVGSTPLGASAAEVRWTVPAEVGRAWAWVVVTDDRGGASWASAEFEVM